MSSSSANPYQAPPPEQVRGSTEQLADHVGLMRLLLIAQLALIPISLALDIWLRRFLPLELVEYIEVSSAAINVGQVIASFALLLFMLIYIAASVLLLFGKRIARWPYLFSHLALLVILPFIGPIVSHPLNEAITILDSCLVGATLILLFVPAYFRSDHGNRS